MNFPPRTLPSAILAVLFLGAACLAYQSGGLPPISGPEEFLRLRGVEEEHWQALATAQQSDAQAALARLHLLFAVRQVPAADVERWSIAPPAGQQLFQAPQRYRGQIFQLSGSIRRLSVETPSQELAARFQIEKYYRCELVLAGDGDPATVYALDVPRSWQADAPLDEPASAYAFFVDARGGAAGSGQRLFVSQRVAWHPATVLGKLGMDVGLFDQIRTVGPLSQSAPGADRVFSDRECFYQLLAAAGRAPAGQLERRTSGKKSSVIPLLRNPGEHLGDLVALEGVARRALLVRVDDADIVSRLGIDHYYEVELTVKLEQPLRIGDELFESFPVVLCLRRLPEGMPTGERINEAIRAPAFFFKIWTYHSEAARRKGDASRQAAPLLVGDEPLWIRSQPIDHTSSGLVFGALFVFGIALLWLIVWRMNRGDNRFHQRLIERRFAVPSTDHLTTLSEAPPNEPAE